MSTQWWKNSVVYQIYPISFQDTTGSGTGDLRGIIDRLDYLKELGVDVLWLCPIYKSPNIDNGYDISDYCSIQPSLGTMADFDDLLCQAHKRGIKIVMDLVVNHSSDQHPWFVESRQSRKSEKHDWYLWRDSHSSDVPNKLQSVFSGSAWTYDENCDQYYLHLFAKEQPDLNWSNPDMRSAIYKMMRWWLDKGVDGFRMDVISMIAKPEEALLSDGLSCPIMTNNPQVHVYLREMNREVLRHYDIMTVGETSDATVEDALQYANLDGSELSMAFGFEHVEIGNGPNGKWTSKRFNLNELRDIITKWQLGLKGKAWNSLFWGNHDQPRAVSRFGDDRPEFRERSAKMLAICLHMLQGTPYIYQGEELGMTNAYFTDLSQYKDIESLRAFDELTQSGKLSEDEMLLCLQLRGRDNARTPMQWDSSKNAGFSVGAPWLPVNENYRYINAQEQLQRQDSVFFTYQKLIRLRHELSIVTDGEYSLIDGNTEHLWCYSRRADSERLIVLCNFSDISQPCQWVDSRSEQEIIIANYDEHITGILQPYEAIVYRERY